MTIAMQQKNSMEIFIRASEMLAEANTIQKAHDLRNLALTAADWARRKGMGEVAVQHATSYALQAERKMGEMLAASERAKGAKGIGPPIAVTGGNRNGPPTLAEIGVTKRASAEAQKLAALPVEKFEAVRSGAKTRTQVKREMVAAAVIKKVSLPDAKFRVLYADPPWSYGNTQPDYHTEQRDHYPVMLLADICALPVPAICEDDAVLFLWTTSPMLEESFQVVRAWGFAYKASFVWDKVKHNMGHYNSVRHEFLLVCTKGSCQPDVPKLFDSVVSAERTEHSAKPAEFYEIIETLYPHGKRLELFARGPRGGWDVFGHEA